MSKKDELKKTTSDFVNESKIRFPNMYTYENTEYLGAKTKVKINCPQHGEFSKLPGHHLKSNGCPKCSLVEKSVNQTKTVQQFIKEAITIHGDTYDYSKVVYTKNYNKVIIVCKLHGEFTQVAATHLNGSGCQECASAKSSAEQVKSSCEFILEANQRHGYKYGYDNLVYINAKEKVTVTCPEHGNFSVQANSHLQGSGCARCSESGFKDHLPGIVYYLRVVNKGEVAYKVGITNRSVKERFGSDMKFITVIKTWDFVLGKDARDKEREVLTNFKEHKWKGENLLESGNTELFDIDILELDYE